MTAGESEERWIPIRYGGFWDVPRTFHLCWRGVDLIFDSPFDESLDDDSPEYTVVRVPTAPPNEGAWLTCLDAGIPIGRIAVGQVRFDETRRRSVDRASIESVLRCV